ncbi:hypothetical protein [uncultured Pelagibacterium sp.]|uniref:hypothetical protein n=1 Tax=uncultured Pelagibacterium sp. TaxID=1159875 RepID=UPI0030D72A58|tara:strand:+ start:6473 stop:6772 length:300 start_codon:yes stop_codon:yes gene_type:complete
MNNVYSRVSDTDRRANRVVVLLTSEELDALDQWAAPAGFPSRSAAIREVLFGRNEKTETVTGAALDGDTPATVDQNAAETSGNSVNSGNGDAQDDHQGE